MAASARRIENSTTPRPSISPLSTASKPNRSSPITTRDAIMANRALRDDLDIEDDGPGEAAEDDNHPDDGSSSLSEPEDDRYYEDMDNNLADGTDDDAAVAVQKSLEVDSEAETERLDQTPQRARRQADGTGRTPSKLMQASGPDDELSDPPSPLPAGVGAASSTSTAATAGQKRKRSETVESSLTSAESDLGESPRKRSHGSPPEAELEASEEKPGSSNDVPEFAVEESVEDAIVVEDDNTPAATTTKAIRGRKGKQKGKKHKDAVEEPAPASVDDSAEADEEPSAEAQARSEEELKHKSEASTLFEELAKQFTSFREKLYNERLESLTAELNMLAQPNCEHPEYQRQVAAIDARLDKQTRETHAFYKYRLQCIKERTLGERSQLLGQYFQEAREMREKFMYKLGEDWYNIQKERRQSHQDKDEAYIYKFPAKKSVQIAQQAKYNHEVSVLSGMAKYVGFPAAPDINGAQAEAMDNDLKAMKIPRRVPQPAAQPPAATYNPRPSASAMSAMTAQSERLAHEQFIEQNAWARPPQPTHSTIGTPGAGVTHTPDWAEQPQTNPRNLSRPGLGRRVSGPFTTPVADKRGPMEHSSAGTLPLNSDGAEPPSSVQAAPPTMDRMMAAHPSNGNEQHSPLSFAKPRQNGTDLPGMRNISNISGTSTIEAPETAQEREAFKRPPGILNDGQRPQQSFDTSQLHGNGNGKEVQAGGRFRPQEGVFGTPAPLPTAHTQ